MRRKTGWMVGLGSLLAVASVLGMLSHRRPAAEAYPPHQDDEACKEQNPDVRPERCDDHAHGHGGSYGHAYYSGTSGNSATLGNRRASASEQEGDSHTGTGESEGSHGGSSGEAESAGHAGFGGHAAGHGGGE